VPSVLLVPMLAFDRAGWRLGYGGGFFDRTLASLRAADPDTVAVGVAFAGQLRDAVPVGAHDQRLDWIVTDAGALEVAG
jgi:5-formyltetrahydrofolate cyclo-ligase